MKKLFVIAFLVSLFTDQQAASSATCSTPSGADAIIVTDDLARFDHLLDRLSETTEPERVIKRFYLGPATPGLDAYASNFGIGAEALAAAIAEEPAFYESLRGLTSRIEENRSAICAVFSGWERIYADALFPPTYLFIGTRRAGGIARPEGLLISAELYSAPARAAALTNNSSTHSLNALPHLIAHELAHYQQFTVQGLEQYRALYRGKTTLLGLAIREGSADFLAELASDGHINKAAHEYGRQHEKELWERFRKDMLGNETGDWMFRKPKNGDWPQDLGYFVGYVITESFYRRQVDKQKAVEEILAVTNFEEFLERSGYGAQGRGSSR